MQAAQHVPATTFQAPKVGKAVIVALAAAILGGVLALQAPWAASGGLETSSAADVNAALVQVRAGERESLGIGQATDVNAALVQVRAGERESLGIGPAAVEAALIEVRAGERESLGIGQASGIARTPGSRGHFAN